jgi:hypothetical protein
MGPKPPGDRPERGGPRGFPPLGWNHRRGAAPPQAKKKPGTRSGFFLFAAVILVPTAKGTSGDYIRSFSLSPSCLRVFMVSPRPRKRGTTRRRDNRGLLGAFSHRVSLCVGARRSYVRLGENRFHHEGTKTRKERAAFCDDARNELAVWFGRRRSSRRAETLRRRVRPTARSLRGPTPRRAGRSGSRRKVTTRGAFRPPLT